MECGAHDNRIVLNFGPLKETYVLHIGNKHYTLHDKGAYFRGTKHYINPGCSGSNNVIERIIPKFEYKNNSNFIDTIPSEFKGDKYQWIALVDGEIKKPISAAFRYPLSKDTLLIDNTNNNPIAVLHILELLWENSMSPNKFNYAIDTKCSEENQAQINLHESEQTPVAYYVLNADKEHITSEFFEDYRTFLENSKITGNTIPYSIRVKSGDLKPIKSALEKSGAKNYFESDNALVFFSGVLKSRKDRRILENYKNYPLYDTAKLINDLETFDEFR